MLRLMFNTKPHPAFVDVEKHLYSNASKAQGNHYIGNQNADLAVGERTVFPDVNPRANETDDWLAKCHFGGRTCIRFLKVERTINKQTNEPETISRKQYITYNPSTGILTDGSKYTIKSGQQPQSESSDVGNTNSASELMIQAGFWINTHLCSEQAPYMVLVDPKPSEDDQGPGAIEVMELPSMPEEGPSVGRIPNADRGQSISAAAEAEFGRGARKTTARQENLETQELSAEVVRSNGERVIIRAQSVPAFDGMVSSLVTHGVWEQPQHTSHQGVARSLMNLERIEDVILRHGIQCPINTTDWIGEVSGGVIHRDNTSVYNSARNILYSAVVQINGNWKDRGLNQEIAGDWGTQPNPGDEPGEFNLGRVKNWYTRERSK